MLHILKTTPFFSKNINEQKHFQRQSSDIKSDVTDKVSDMSRHNLTKKNSKLKQSTYGAAVFSSVQGGSTLGSAVQHLHFALLRSVQVTDAQE